MNTPLQTTSFDDIAHARAILLTTFRRDGSPVGTPIWFVVRNGTIYATTTATSGKVKRIRNTSRVLVAPCTQLGKVTGPTYEGRARVLTEQEMREVLSAIRRRYGILDLIFSLLNRFQGQNEEVALELTPAGY